MSKKTIKKKAVKKKVAKKKAVKKKEKTQYIARFYSHESLETVSKKINKLYKLGEVEEGPAAFVGIMPVNSGDRLSNKMEGLRCWLNSRSWNTGTLDFWCGEKYAEIQTTDRYADGELGSLFVDTKLRQKSKAKPSPITFYNRCMNITITDFEVEKEEEE